MAHAKKPQLVFPSTLLLGLSELQDAYWGLVGNKGMSMYIGFRVEQRSKSLYKKKKKEKIHNP